MNIFDTKKSAGLGFGAMRMPEEEETRKMVDAYMESEYNYFDTAHIYGGSEQMLNKTLTSRHKRDSYTIASKLPRWQVKTLKDADRLLGESLQRLNVDYLDFYLAHSLDDSVEQFLIDLEIFPWLTEQKKKGLVKHIGFSFHGTTPFLEKLLQNYPEAEFVQLQLNYSDCLRGPASQWQNLAIKYNKPIIVMEPIKGGTLARLPQAAADILKKHAPERSIASWAMQYAATLEGATCILSGMSSLLHVQDNINTFKNFLRPLDKNELGLLNEVLNEIAKVGGIPCTACKYCHENCPQGLLISELFALYNDLKQGGDKWNRDLMYNTLPKDKRANSCIKCNACLEHCPQHINIPEELVRVAKSF